MPRGSSYTTRRRLGSSSRSASTLSTCSWSSDTITAPSAAQCRRGRWSPMTDSRSPRLNPSAASPSAKSRTSSWYWPHVHVCQMPRSFSRIAGRLRNSRAFRRSNRESVVSATGASGAGGLAVTEIRLDDARVRPHLVRRALGDLLAHVEHGDAIGDVHDHAHVVLDQDDGDAPFLVDVEDEAGHVLLLLVVAAAHGLVEQQDLRVERQGAAELDALLQPVGERAGGGAPPILGAQGGGDVLEAPAGR